MTNNFMQRNQTRTSNGWIYTLLLFISFIWVSVYPSVNILTENFYFGYGNLFDTGSGNFPYIITMVLSEALFYWLAFELVFYFYRYVLSFKVYSFIVPLDRLKVESRIFFIYRNVFYGLFMNLCFLYPYLNIYAEFVNLIITLIVLLVYVKHLNKTYAEPVIGHFVFKNFCFPVFVYEALVLISGLLEVLS